MLEKKLPRRQQTTVYLDDEDAQIITEIMTNYNLSMNQAIRTCIKHALEMYSADNNVNNDLTLPARIFAGAKKAVYKHDIQKRVENGYCR